MSFSLSCRNIRLDGTILYAECGDGSGGYPASEFHLDAVLGNYDGNFRWLWQDFQLSASDIRLEGSILHARLNPVEGEPVEASVNLDERISNRYGELTYDHGGEVSNTPGQKWMWLSCKKMGLLFRLPKTYTKYPLILSLTQTDFVLAS